MFITGFVFCFFGFFFTFFLEYEIYAALTAALVLDSPSASGFSTWSNNSQAPFKISVYVYNLTNLESFLNGSKPIVEEVGPFVYENYQYKVNYSWSQEQEILTYSNFNQFFLVASESAFSTDNVTIVMANLVYSSLVSELSGTEDQKRQLYLCFGDTEVNGADHNAFTSRTVNELLFGYPDDALGLAHFFNPSISPNFPGILNANMSSPSDVNPAKQDAIYTGKSSDHFREIYQYQGKTVYTVCGACDGSRPTTLLWATEQASTVGGSLGILHPGVDFGSVSFELFRPDALRRVRYFLDIMGPEPIGLYKDIRTFRFQMDPRELWNQTEYPPNAVYYQNGSSGFFNVSSGSFAPIFLSNPHFIHVGEPAASAVDCIYIEPSAVAPQLFEIDPYSGVSIHLVQSTQINVQVGPVTGMVFSDDTTFNVTWNPSLPEVILPVLWIQTEASIDDATAEKYRNDVYGALELAAFCFWLSVPLGCLLIFGGFLMYSLGYFTLKQINADHYRARSSFDKWKGETGVSFIPDPVGADSTSFEQ